MQFPIQAFLYAYIIKYLSLQASCLPEANNQEPHGINGFRGFGRCQKGEVSDADQVAFVEAAGGFATAYEIGPVRLLLRQHIRQLSDPKVTQYGAPVSPCQCINRAQRQETQHILSLINEVQGDMCSLMPGY